MIIPGRIEVISIDFGNTGNQNIKSKELVYHPYYFIPTWFDKARAGIKLRLGDWDSYPFGSKSGPTNLLPKELEVLKFPGFA